MKTRSAYRAAASSRAGRMRDSEQQDRLSGVIVIQIGVCIFLLVLCFVMKMSGSDFYQQSRENIQQMMYQSKSVDLSAIKTQGIGAITEKIRQTIQNMLGEASMVFKSSSENDEKGQGGMYPVKIDLSDSRKALSPPEGATLSPVVTTASFLMPVNGTLTCGFGYRYHPITNQPDFHMGVDLAAAADSPIVASLGGVVEEVGSSRIYGNYLIIKHSEHLKTFYGHCQEIIVQEGTKVRRGLRVATVGSTGISTGPHLHFGVIVDGLYTDPAWVMEGLRETEEG